MSGTLKIHVPGTEREVTRNSRPRTEHFRIEVGSSGIAISEFPRTLEGYIAYSILTAAETVCSRENRILLLMHEAKMIVHDVKLHEAGKPWGPDREECPE